MKFSERKMRRQVDHLTLTTHDDDLCKWIRIQSVSWKMRRDKSHRPATSIILSFDRNFVKIVSIIFSIERIFLFWKDFFLGARCLSNKNWSKQRRHRHQRWCCSWWCWCSLVLLALCLSHRLSIWSHRRTNIVFINKSVRCGAHFSQLEKIHWKISVMKFFPILQQQRVNHGRYGRFAMERKK